MGSRGSTLKKIFISHSKSDEKYVSEMIGLIESMGIKSEQIFCTSVTGYGIKFGEDFLERIKKELSEEVLVIFLLSNNFYSSPVCLCEMGATWIKTNVHIPILIPPFEYKDIKGVIANTQGFKINEILSWSEMKDIISENFDVKISSAIWEQKKELYLKNIKDLLEKDLLITKGIISENKLTREEIENVVFELRNTTVFNLLYTGLRNGNDFLEFCLNDFSDTWLVKEISKTSLSKELAIQIKMINRYLENTESRHKKLKIVFIVYKELREENINQFLYELNNFKEEKSLSDKITFEIWDKNYFDSALDI